jgi:glycosyltransferase involved in cell wall biosynthesis
MKYLIITNLGFPMGGGESYMRQSCIELAEYAKCYWLSFSNVDGRYNTDSLKQRDYYLEINSSAVNIEETIRQTIQNIKPDLIHTQGDINYSTKKIAEELGVNCIVGYHFWNNFINLESNIEILKNISKVSISDKFGSDSPNIYEYVASDFMEDVYKACGGKQKLNIIYPLSSDKDYKFIRNDKSKDSYVLQLNISDLKGGQLFFDCAKNIPKLQFCGINAEKSSSLIRKFNKFSNVTIKDYTNPAELYRNARLVMVPTLVDETFCRVAYEAVMNNIPVLSSDKGFLKKLLGNSGIFLNKSNEYINWINKNYDNDNLLKKIALNQKIFVKNLIKKHNNNFLKVARFFLDRSNNKNIGFFCSWSDQGQGNHAHLYTKLLRELGYKISIFSFQPYNQINKGLTSQKSKKDWSSPKNADYIYYSFNNREEVSDYELLQFIRVNKIRTLIVLEVCWQKNWDRLFKLKKMGINIIIVPLIEIVRKKEIHFHNYFDMTLCCTRQTYDVLKSNGIENLQFIGHGAGQKIHKKILSKKIHLLNKTKEINFLHIAGHNPLHRKNTKKVIQAFSDAVRYRKDIRLTVTSIVPKETYSPMTLSNKITIIDRPLSREEIQKLYEKHNISIQVSSHEGLGLGFYESISNLCPVISLNGKPHNEIVKEKITGFLVKTKAIQVPDNQESLVNALDFNVKDLRNKIIGIQKNNLRRLLYSSFNYYNLNFTSSMLKFRLASALSLFFNSEINSLGKSNKETQTQTQTQTLFIRLNFYLLLKIITSFIRFIYRHINELFIKKISLTNRIKLQNKISLFYKYFLLVDKKYLDLKLKIISSKKNNLSYEESDLISKLEKIERIS